MILTRSVNKQMEIKAKEKTGLLMFGFLMAWIALFLMLTNIYEIFFVNGDIVWWIIWVVSGLCALGSSLFLGVGFGAEFEEKS
jgi:hypothetical protein